jgi:hypothetical protein
MYTKISMTMCLILQIHAKKKLKNNIYPITSDEQLPCLLENIKLIPTPVLMLGRNPMESEI